MKDDGISMLFCHVQHKVRMRLDGQIALRTKISEVLPDPISAIWTHLALFHPKLRRQKFHLQMLQY